MTNLSESKVIPLIAGRIVEVGRSADGKSGEPITKANT